MTQSFLGGETTYVNQYDPSQLLPIDRGEGRSELGIQSSLPFQGVDLWNATLYLFIDHAYSTVSAGLEISSLVPDQLFCELTQVVPALLCSNVGHYS